MGKEREQGWSGEEGFARPILLAQRPPPGFARPRRSRFSGSARIGAAAAENPERAGKTVRGCGAVEIAREKNDVRTLQHAKYAYVNNGRHTAVCASADKCRRRKQSSIHPPRTSECSP